VTAAVTDRDRGLAALAHRLAGNMRVRVGILADAMKADDSGTTLLEVAVINEFGGGHVPQRSFIRATVDENIDRIHAAQAALAKRIILSQITPEQAMAQLGALVKGMIQARISRGIEPPNAPSTIAAKGSSKPLISTGQLRSSVDYAVESES